MKTNPLAIFADRHPKASYYMLLVAALVVAFLGTNAWMLAQGRELVWTQDALPLYCNFLVYCSQAVHDAVAAAQAGNDFTLPEYTYSMGYGADVPMTMGSYIQDPINLIPFILPNNLIGLGYTLMVLVRMVLAGVAFSWYCFARGHDRKATFVASLAYATCGFIVFLGAFRHPKFMDWAIILPLILQGADRLFDKKGPAFLLAALVAQFIISIYFSYMSCIVLVVYCLLKYFAAPRERSVADFALLVGKFAACGIVAFLISGIFSFPQITALLSQGRATSGATTVPALFTLKYYTKVAAHLIGAAGTTEGMVMGATSTIGLAVFALCRKRFARGIWIPWAIGLGLCFAGVLIPYLGHIMNGMGYSTDRWMLVLAFVCSYVLCMALPRLRELGAHEWRRLNVAVAAIAALTVAYGLAQIALADGFAGSVWPLCMAALFVGTYLGMKKLAGRALDAKAAAFAACAVLVCASVSGIFYCSPLGMNWGTTFAKAGNTWKSLSVKTPAAAADKVDDATLWRYSVARVYDSMKNSPLAHGQMAVDYYTSFYNQRVDDFRQELGISDHHMNFSFAGSDSRLAIETFTGVKYYICKSNDEWRVPYGFADTGIEHRDYKVYRNQNAMPLAFLADSVITRQAYEALSMVQKQEALLQGAVVDADALDAPLPQAQLTLESASIDYRVVETDGVVVEGGVLHVLKRGASMQLSYRGLPDAETYLAMKNLGFAEYAPSQLAQLNGLTQSALKGRINDILWTRNTTYPITALVGDRSKSINPATPEHLRYGGKVDWVFNLGYDRNPTSVMTVKFDVPGDYTFDSIEVVCLPVAGVVENAHALAQRGLDDLELGTNRIDATCTLQDDDPCIAVFTFAYTPGWSVTVDGVGQDPLVVDTCFLGVQVKGAGTHQITWHYTTPGLKAGAIASACGILLVVVLALAGARMRLRR